jgi:CheY-like chemotaxis protein
LEARRKVLIVEDEWIIALDLKISIERKGYQAVGPAPTVAMAIELVETSAVDGAILDVKLFQENSFPVADLLHKRKIPFVFATGYSPGELPEQYDGVAVLGKPHDDRELSAALRDMFGG